MENLDKFMQLLEDALVLQNNNNVKVTDTIDGANALVTDATKLVQSSARPDEVILDAKVLSVSTNVLTHCVKSIDGNLYAFNTNLYVDSILEYISIEGNKSRALHDWSRLYPLADVCCKKTTSLEYMLGTFKPGEREPKKRKERVAKQAEHKGPVVKPQNVQLGEKQEDGIEDSLQLVMKVLSGMHRKNSNKPICYFKLVVNPESFGATVENTYHVSFLVKDGLVELSLDGNGLPVVSPKSKKPTTGDGTKKARCEPDTNQCIISWNFEDWQDIIETFNITRARIPRRDTAKATSQQ